MKKKILYSIAPIIIFKTLFNWSCHFKYFNSEFFHSISEEIVDDFFLINSFSEDHFRFKLFSSNDTIHKELTHSQHVSHRENENVFLVPHNDRTNDCRMTWQLDSNQSLFG